MIHRAPAPSWSGQAKVREKVMNPRVCVYLKQDGAASGKGIPEHLGRVLLQQALTCPAGSAEAGKKGGRAEVCYKRNGARAE